MMNAHWLRVWRSTPGSGALGRSRSGAVVLLRSATLMPLLLATAAPILAQQPPAVVQHHAALQPLLPLTGTDPGQFAADQRSTGRLVAGGLAGGAAGALAGGLLAAGLRALGPCDDQDGCLDRYAEWAISGAILGQSLGLPVGVHFANHRQGHLPPALLASAGIGTAGLLAYRAIQRYGTDDWGNTRGNPDALTAVTIVAMPVLEMVASIAIERTTSRRRRQR
jgi:hypothetical protein